MYRIDARTRLYQLALRMNPQQVTYRVRTTANSSPAGAPVADSFTAYTLYRATFREPTRKETIDWQLALASKWQIWTLYDPDLTQASAPAPEASYEIVLANGETWEVNQIVRKVTNVAYECLCRRGRDTILE